MIVWKVIVEGRSCIFEHFNDAWADFKTHDYDRLIYPVLMSKTKFNSLKEFTGW